MYYTLANGGQLLDHLKATCGVLHALNVLILQNEIQWYHLDSEDIPEYINNLKDAQVKSKRTNNPITNTTLVFITTNTVFSTEKLSCANKD